MGMDAGNGTHGLKNKACRKSELLFIHKLLTVRVIIVRHTYVITGGYTAGHVTPGLAIAAALLAQRPELNLLFMGAQNGIEESLVRRDGLAFAGLPAAPWLGQGFAGRARALRLLGPSVLIARRQLRECGAVGLTGLGSFASVAPGIAAWSLGLPVTLYESNAQLGLANRLLKPFAKRLLVSSLFESPSPGCDVGVPLHESLTELAVSPPTATGELRVLVLGGSLGSPFFNVRLPETLAALKTLTGRTLHITHQCGHDVDSAPIIERYKHQGVAADIVRFIPALGPQLAAAHIVISTAGAISLHELAAAGVPAVISPLPGVAEKHQLANARAFARVTGSIVYSHHDWQAETVAQGLANILTDPACWQRQREGLRRFARPQATKDFLAAILRDLPASAS